MTDDVNPYLPPKSQSPTPEITGGPGVKDTLTKWRKLWLYYNGSMFVIGMLASAPALIKFPELIPFIFFYAILANICFCAGPLIDVLSVIFFNNQSSTLRNALFAFGLSGSILLTILLGTILY